MAEVPRDANKLVVFNFLQWLADLRAKDPNLAALENLEVATQCLTDAFGVELANEEQQKSLSIKPMALSAVIEAARFQMEAVNKRAAQDVNDPRWLAFLATLKKAKYFTATEGTPEYQKQLEHARTLFKQKTSAPSTPPIAPAAAPASPSSPTTATTTDTTSNVAFSPEDRKKRAEEAEKYKAEGNQKLSDRQYHAAVEAYSRAIELNPANAIYFANRAAAYEFLGDSEKAILDCKESIRVDPNYAKAYSRLGLSFFSLGCYKDAVEQYRKAVQLDANNSAYRESLTKAELKLAQHPDAPTYASRSSSSSPSSAAKPPPAAAATTPGGGGGGAFAGASMPPAGAGGASSLPQMPPGFPPMDPEAMKGMMNDLGGLGNIMSNPAFLGMAQKMMSDPQFMQMAQSMMQNPEMATMLGNMAHAKK